MSSFLDELKQKLKSGSANAELKIITNGHKPSLRSPSTGIQWGKILGILGAVAVIVMLIFGIMLFLNNQKEKNLNVMSDTPVPLMKKQDEEEDDPITDLDFKTVNTASERINEKKPPANTDPNFTLLSELL